MRSRPSSALVPGLVLAGLVLTTAGCGGARGQAATTADASPSEQTATAEAGDHGSSGASARAMPTKPLGSETWQGMRIALASMSPQRFTIFQGTRSREVTPSDGADMHVMAVLSDAQSHERIPYADCWLTVRDDSGKVVLDERLWPMLSRDVGMHYGINLSLPEPGHYTAKLRVGPPQAARHPEYADVWRKPHTVTVPLAWKTS